MLTKETVYCEKCHNNPTPWPCAINSNYEIRMPIGKGSCGDVFKGKDVIVDQDVAIKIEDGVMRSTIKIEAEVYKDLHQKLTAGETSIGIPHIHWFGTGFLWNKVYHNILVMENLGPDLNKLFLQTGGIGQFSTKTVLMLAEQFLNRIEFVHERNYIHRDIKPENLLMGLGESKGTVYLADYGIAKKNDEKYEEDFQVWATPEFASINTHLGISQSKRDDMVSIGYSLMLFLCGTLPWYELKGWKVIGEAKKLTPVEDICKGYPIEFHMYLHYCYGLQFDERPDYDYLRKLFEKLFHELGYEYDWIFDWSTWGSEESGSEESYD